MDDDDEDYEMDEEDEEDEDEQDSDDDGERTDVATDYGSTFEADSDYAPDEVASIAGLLGDLAVPDTPQADAAPQVRRRLCEFLTPRSCGARRKLNGVAHGDVDRSALQAASAVSLRQVIHRAMSAQKCDARCTGPPALRGGAARAPQAAHAPRAARGRGGQRERDGVAAERRG